MVTCLLSLCLIGPVAQTMPAAATQSQPAASSRPAAETAPAAASQPAALPDRPVPPAVWAIGEGFRVDPLTGRVREEQRLGGNPIPADFDYTRKNLTWDAATGRITLFAARNEVVGVQLHIRGPVKGVTVACSDLKGPGTIKAAQDIEVLKQWYLNVQEDSSNRDSTTAGYNLGKGWYADALIPVGTPGGFGQPFDIPDRVNNIPNQQWQSIWIDIYVPRDVPPGEYSGTVTIRSQEGLPEHNLPLTLKVFDVALSDDFACEVGLNNYGSIGRKGSQTRLRYYQMAHRHRMAIHEHYIAPRTEGTGEQMRGIWDEYDAEMDKYFTGEAFTAACGYRGPGEGRPLRWAYLPFEILGGHAWPMPKAAMRTAEYNQAVRAMLRDFANHFEHKRWTNTNLMFFVNGLDEPTKAEAVDDIRYFGDLVKAAQAPRVSYRADVNHLHDIGTRIPGWNEQMMLKKLAPVIDLWCCVADFKRTDFSVLLARKKCHPNLAVWFYQNREPSVGGYTLDDETIGLATWPVIVYKYGLDGCILWECIFAGPSRNLYLDPNNSVAAERGVVHNLAGCVIYPAFPGRPEIVEPIASIRLKSFRRGAQDFEYLRLYEQAAGRERSLKMLGTVLGDCLHQPNRPYGAAGDWSHNPEDWNRFRIGLLQAIVEASKTKNHPAPASKHSDSLH